MFTSFTLWFIIPYKIYNGEKLSRNVAMYLPLIPLGPHMRSITKKTNKSNFRMFRIFRVQKGGKRFLN